MDRLVTGKDEMKEKSKNYQNMPHKDIVDMARCGADHIEPLFLPVAKVLEEVTDRLEAYRLALGWMICEHSDCGTCGTHSLDCESVIEQIESRVKSAREEI